MPDRRPLRRLLVVSNLMLVLAPHVARADRELTRQAEPKIEPAPNTHHAPGKVRPQPQSSPSPSPSPRTRTTSQPADDDDGGGEAAGEVASACCAGMIGAMTEPSTPEDVDLPPMPEEPVDPPIAYGAGGAHPAPGGDSGAPASAPFDRRAADRELSAATTRALEHCGPSDYEVAARVTFHPSGEPLDVTFTPTGFTNTENGQCVEGKLLEARVPPFAGSPTAVETKLTLD